MTWIWAGQIPASCSPALLRRHQSKHRPRPRSQTIEVFRVTFFHFLQGPRLQSAGRKWLRWKDFLFASVFGKPNICLGCSPSKTHVIGEISAQVWLVRLRWCRRCTWRQQAQWTLNERAPQHSLLKSVRGNIPTALDTIMILIKLRANYCFSHISRCKFKIAGLKKKRYRWMWFCRQQPDSPSSYFGLKATSNRPKATLYVTKMIFSSHMKRIFIPLTLEHKHLKNSRCQSRADY